MSKFSTLLRTELTSLKGILLNFDASNKALTWIAPWGLLMTSLFCLQLSAPCVRSTVWNHLLRLQGQTNSQMCTLQTCTKQVRTSNKTTVVCRWRHITTYFKTSVHFSSPNETFFLNTVGVEIRTSQTKQHSITERFKSQNSSHFVWFLNGPDWTKIKRQW